MRKPILLLIASAIFAGTAGYGVRTALNSTTQEQRPAYTVVWRVTEYYADGTNRPRYLETRQVSASGKWHTVKNGGDTNEESFGEPGKGVFIKGRQRMYFVSQYTAPPPMMTEEKLLKSPNYLRTDTVLGYKAIVVGSGNRPRTGSEFYAVPALGGEILKTVLGDNATGHKVIYEPISLTLGEPPAAALNMPTDFPIDYETVKSRRPGGSAAPSP